MNHLFNGKLINLMSATLMALSVGSVFASSPLVVECTVLDKNFLPTDKTFKIESIVAERPGDDESVRYVRQFWKISDVRNYSFPVSDSIDTSHFDDDDFIMYTVDERRVSDDSPAMDEIIGIDVQFQGNPNISPYRQLNIASTFNRGRPLPKMSEVIGYKFWLSEKEERERYANYLLDKGIAGRIYLSDEATSKGRIETLDLIQCAPLTDTRIYIPR